MHESEVNEQILHDSANLSESDLELINALQIDPRASWYRLGEVLDVAPSTLSRRWQALVQAGLAWVTTAPGAHHLDSGSTAFVLLSVKPGRIPAVLEGLRAEPMFGTISQIAGTHDLLVDCLTPTAADLTGLLSRGGDIAEEVIQREAMVATRLHRDATRWRAGAIERGKARQIGEGVGGRAASPVRDSIDAGLIDALGVDGRMSWTELGERCGVAPATARRRVESLLAAGAFSLRCDAAAPLKQGRRGITLLLDVPAAHLESVGRWFSGRLDCRVCAEVVGQANLLVTLWLQTFAELHACEITVTGLAPGTRVVGRHIELSTVKRVGVLLDEHGRNRGRVPLTLVDRA
ncbi:Lrp/AsnC family transcriptional regulator [Leucobacter sp. wl10]|uniref:Lrp/AsnC family transcriptional regulator n=1 Tax=Leucobacter sp. wl10 TaxID=2304677 RepID=UPI000E5A6367|nr:AsnC family transcriptional regulator [Leucobacter sp. wl10]RGE23715.1 AsnC family transcriptional regulator [Leucobacter sp. wl10]